jgi:hypothetical protein
MRSRCCLCVSVCVSPPLTLEWITNIYETWCVYDGTWAHLSSVIHKSLPSVIPASQLIRLLRENLNIDWRPVPILMELGVCISFHLRPSQWRMS